MKIAVTSILVWIAKRVVSSAAKRAKDEAERDEIIRELMSEAPTKKDWEAFERYKAEAREKAKPDAGRI